MEGNVFRDLGGPFECVEDTELTRREVSGRQNVTLQMSTGEPGELTVKIQFTLTARGTQKARL